MWNRPSFACCMEELYEWASFTYPTNKFVYTAVKYFVLEFFKLHNFY